MFKSFVESEGKLKPGIIIILIILGIVLMVVPGMFSSSKKETSSPVITETQVTEEIFLLEEKLAKKAVNILQEIKGVGSVSVAVNLAAGFEQEYLCNSKSQIEKTVGESKETLEVNEEKEYLLVQNKPLMSKKRSPEIEGVLVVAEGASAAKIKRELNHAVQALFHLPAHRIIILPKESRE
ncbi:MAG TPA: hypothetical protein GX687_00365 [Clostridia bacterium]|nr:hypothetical protein [Clostridia bacterium]